MYISQPHHLPFGTFCLYEGRCLYTLMLMFQCTRRRPRCPLPADLAQMFDEPIGLDGALDPLPAPSAAVVAVAAPARMLAVAPFGLQHRQTGSGAPHKRSLRNNLPLTPKPPFLPVFLSDTAPPLMTVGLRLGTLPRPPRHAPRHPPRHPPCHPPRHRPPRRPPRHPRCPPILPKCLTIQLA